MRKKMLQELEIASHDGMLDMLCLLLGKRLRRCRHRMEIVNQIVDQLDSILVRKGRFRVLEGVRKDVEGCVGECIVDDFKYVRKWFEEYEKMDGDELTERTVQKVVKLFRDVLDNVQVDFTVLKEEVGIALLGIVEEDVY